MNSIHVPVMPHLVLETLSPTVPNPLVVDGTLGEGGHTLLFLEKWPGSRVIGIDADPKMGLLASQRLAGYGDRIKLLTGWNNEVLTHWQEDKPDVIFLDLGISSRHYADGGGGFSFTAEEPLDMRLDGKGESAADLVNDLKEEELVSLINTFGEERFSRRIARGIVERRYQEKILRTVQLADIVKSAYPRKARYGRRHPATRTFQALRIAVNKELERLADLLEILPPLLAAGGKLGIISFHSLEDRLVKNAFRRLDKRFGGDFQVLTYKPLVPDKDEVKNNPSSRSAKLRVIQK